MPRRRAVIIGAGVGGLVAAIELARYGLAVTILEKDEAAGGKMKAECIDGARFDSGPTVLTMRWVFDDIFVRAGRSLDAAVQLRRSEVLARHAWADSSTFDLYADIDRSADAIGQFSGSKDADGFRRFCRDSERIYNILQTSFIEADRPTLPGLAWRVGLQRIAQLGRIKPFSRLWTELGRYFEDPRLRQLFGRYSTYSGSSPLQSPATLMVIFHVERLGVWLVAGGLFALADALVALARDLGVSVHYGATVRKINVAAGQVKSIELDSGAEVPADIAICNADTAALSGGFLGKEASGGVRKIKAAERSLSAVTWTGLAITAGFPLAHHNVFFGDDYPSEFAGIQRQIWPPDTRPTVYVCAQDRDDSGVRPLGPDNTERLLCLINAPPIGDNRSADSWEIEACRKITFDHLQMLGLQVNWQDSQMQVHTPTDFATRYPGTGGSLYGSSSHGWMASFRRPAARTRIQGLYLAGGSAHPGAGVPMAAISGRLAAQAVVRDLNLTGP